MKVLVCGPRVWLEQAPIADALREYPRGTILVHGAARGADSIAGFVGELLGFEVRPYEVDPRVDGDWPAAGVLRNGRMLDAEHPSAHDGSYIDVGVAFKIGEGLSRGTADMVHRMTRASPKIEVREVSYVTPGRRLRRYP